MGEGREWGEKGREGGEKGRECREKGREWREKGRECGEKGRECDLYQIRAVVWAPSRELDVLKYLNKQPTLINVISSVKECRSVGGSPASSILCLVLFSQENWSLYRLAELASPSTFAASSR